MTVEIGPDVLLRVVAGVAERLAAEPDVRTVSESVLPAVVGALGAEVATLALRRSERVLRVVATVGIRSDVRAPWVEFDDQADVPLAAAARGGRAIWVPDVEAARDEFPAMPTPTRSASLCALPLRVGPDVLGVLGLGWEHPHDFGDGEKQMLTTAAGLAASACARAALQLRDEATRADRAFRFLPQQRDSRRPVGMPFRLFAVGRVRGGPPDARLHLVDGDGGPLCDGIAAGQRFEPSDDAWDRLPDAVRCQHCRLLSSG